MQDHEPGQLTIYRTAAIDDIQGLNVHIHDLRTSTDVEIRETSEVGVVGEWAGDAISVLLSDPLQALVTATEVGAILWGIVKAAQKAGRRILVKGSAAKAMAIRAASSKPPSKVLGPMEVDASGDSRLHVWILESAMDELLPQATLTGVEHHGADGNTTTTTWVLLTAGGHATSWRTVGGLPDLRAGDPDLNTSAIEPLRVHDLSAPLSDWLWGAEHPVLGILEALDDGIWSTRWTIANRGHHVAAWRTASRKSKRGRTE